MEALEAEAQQWLIGQEPGYDLTVRKEESNMLLERRGMSCIINCPVAKENDKFSVWSESKQLAPHLEKLLNFCESAEERSLTQILNKINTIIYQVLEDASNDDDEEEEEDEEDDYYGADDDDFGDDEIVAAVSRPAAAGSDESEEEEDAQTFFGAGCNPTAILRLKKDLKSMKKEAPKFGIVGSPRGDNLFLWDVKLTGFAADTKLGKDLQAFASKCNKEPVVYLEMQFPGDFPMSPPFVRVTKPRFKFLTGHVTIGGSICMEMLTKSGWTPSNDIEGILVQIRSEIMSDPNARLDANPGREYTETEARDAFNRMVSRYGWNK